MNPSDWQFLSMAVTLLLATTIVPWLVALVIRQQWKDAHKRYAALLVSVGVAAIEYTLRHVAGGDPGWQGLAVTGPIIFALAHASYVTYWKGRLGHAVEFDLIGRVTGWRV